MARKKLTDISINALRPKGRRYDVRDPECPGLVVRVSTARGTVSRVFALQARFGGKTSKATRRTLGVYPRLTLEKARAKARSWQQQLANGKDPRDLEEAEREANQRSRDNTFGKVAQAFFANIHGLGQRNAGKVERELRRHVLPAWGGRPIGSITADHVRALVKELANRKEQTIKKRVLRAAPTTARSVLSEIRSVFDFAIHNGHGIVASPCADIRPGKLDGVGPKRKRQRVLDDVELRALWRAIDRLGRERRGLPGGYPWRQFYQLLLFTGQRREDVAGMRWAELDLAGALWTIPPERFKSGKVHLVPLTGQVIATLREMPQLGEFVFTTAADGSVPISGFGKIKRELDALMEEELGHSLEKGWVNHDVRRTVRTRLSQLRVNADVAELVIGHSLKGLLAVYDQHKFLDERREALELWEGKLHSIVTAPPAAVPDNVLTFAKARA